MATVGGFYETTGPYPQHDSNHFTRFYDVVIKRHEREDSDRPVFGFRMKRWDWEWIGPSIEFIIRHTPLEASKRAKIRRPLEHAFELSESRMQRNPDDEFEVHLMQMLRAEVLRRS